MDTLSNVKEIYEVRKKESEEYQPSQKIYRLGEFISKVISFTGGVFIATLLYNQCLFNPSCNSIVTTFFAILGLAFFMGAGVPIEKLSPKIKF